MVSIVALYFCREKGDEICFKVNFTSPVATLSTSNHLVSLSNYVAALVCFWGEK